MSKLLFEILSLQETDEGLEGKASMCLGDSCQLLALKSRVWLKDTSDNCGKDAPTVARLALEHLAKLPGPTALSSKVDFDAVPALRDHLFQSTLSAVDPDCVYEPPAPRVSASSTVLDISSIAAYRRELARAGDRLVVVFFHATWCRPCKKMEAPFHEAADANETATVFLRVDIDKFPELVRQYDLTELPVFHFIWRTRSRYSFVGKRTVLLRHMIREMERRIQEACALSDESDATLEPIFGRMVLKAAEEAAPREQITPELYARWLLFSVTMLVVGALYMSVTYLPTIVVVAAPFTYFVKDKVMLYLIGLLGSMCLDSVTGGFVTRRLSFAPIFEAFGAQMRRLGFF